MKVIRSMVITQDLDYAANMAAGATHGLLDDALAAYRRAIEAGKGSGDWTEVNTQ